LYWTISGEHYSLNRFSLRGNIVHASMGSFFRIMLSIIKYMFHDDIVSVVTVLLFWCRSLC